MNSRFTEDTWSNSSFNPNGSEFSEELHNTPHRAELNRHRFRASRRSALLEIPEEDKEEGIANHHNTLIGYLYDYRSFGITRMQAYIQEYWGDGITIQSRDANFFFFKFASHSTMLAILHNGPYSVAGALLVLRRWEAEFICRQVRITKVLLWVRIHGIPSEYYTVAAARRIAGMVGEVEEIRASRTNITNGRFLRALVWTRENLPLIPGFYLKLNRGGIIWIACSYERIHKFC